VRVVRAYQLIVFFVLAYVLSWWGAILYAFNHDLAPNASFGPFLAALVVLAITRGKAGVMELLRRMVRWRMAPGWYAVALLLPGSDHGCRYRAQRPPRRPSSLLGQARWLDQTRSGVLPPAAYPRARRRLGGARLEGLRLAPAAD
jgi:hypothetical protein